MTGKYGGALSRLKAGTQEDPNSGIQERGPELPASREPEPQNPRSQEDRNSGIQGKEKYSTLLPSDTVQALKLYAVRHRMKDWEVVDAALRAYLREE